MIKLVVTDVDGTLVKESSNALEPELFFFFNHLSNQGIQFVVASGRQYASIRKLFEPVQDKLIFVAENGAHIVKNETDLFVQKMKTDYVVDIMKDLRTYYPYCHVVASTSKGCLLESKDDQFIDMIKNGYKNETTLVNDITVYAEQILKLAIYQKGGIRAIGESYLIPRWDPFVKTCMAGEDWVDFMDASVDKGNAVRKIQEQLEVSYEDTMTFGDNDNDIGLMKAGYYSYAVENAVEAVKQNANFKCASYNEKGVYQILKTLYE